MAITKNTHTTTTTAGNPYGKRLIPHIIDDIAARNPQQEAFQIPNSADPKDGWKKITFQQWANSINHIARRIVDTCGQAAPGEFPTIAYIGANDARYVILMVAAIKAGYKALYISPRNSQDAQINLFDKTNCHILAFPKSHHAVVQPWLEERDMRAIEVSSLEQWFPAEQVPHFPYNKTWEEAQYDPVAVLHTSGSTGLPKPVVARVGMINGGDLVHDLPEWNGTSVIWRAWAEKSKRQFIPMPLFHAAGLYFFTQMVVFWETPTILGVERAMTPDLIIECLNNMDTGSAVLPPAILEEMSHDAKSIETLKKLDLVAYGGGNMAREAGDRLVNEGVKLMNIIGATEMVPFPLYYQPDFKLWQYFIMNSADFGVEWRPSHEPDVYKMVFVRKDKKDPGYQGIFYTFPDDDEYDTKDLYKRHPDLPDHWIYYGRADNIIVFSNGEKLNPVTIEESVVDHPQLKGAIVVGTGRFQPALLLEPVAHPSTDEERETLLDSIWVLVKKVNKESVAHGQISRDMIFFSAPEKPFLRAGKGTIQRAATLKLYSDEIDKFYAEASNQVLSSETPKLDVSSEDALVKSFQDLFHSHLGTPELDAETDFFSAGVDSLQIINASRLIKAGLEAAGHEVDSSILATRAIYGNPTPRRLARYVIQTVVQGKTTATSADEDAAQQLEAMKFLHEKYTQNLPVANPGRPEAHTTGQTVAVTGTTGMLGSYILDLLCRSPAVAHVFCLNRADDGGVKQQAVSMRERGLDTTYGGGKAEFLHVDVSRSDLGLSAENYARLARETDRFVHNAWPVNFNITIETFEPQLRGVRNIADLAAAHASKRMAVVFISSIGTANAWDPARHGGPMVPETRLEDRTLAVGGYGRSKMVGSLILEDAAKVGDFPAASIRVGQIAGPEAEAGAWNRHEWLPSIVASSLYLRALPSDLGIMTQVDWTPVERIAGLVLDVAGAGANAEKVDTADIRGYYHGVNPSHTTWSQLAKSVQAFYGSDRLPEVVTFAEWIEKLDRSQSDDMQSVDANPGVKLLDSYRGMAAAAAAGAKPVVFDMSRTVGKSPSMRAAKAVTPQLVQHWCKQWGF